MIRVIIDILRDILTEVMFFVTGRASIIFKIITLTAICVPIVFLGYMNLPPQITASLALMHLRNVWGLIINYNRQFNPRLRAVRQTNGPHMIGGRPRPGRMRFDLDIINMPFPIFFEPERDGPVGRHDTQNVHDTSVVAHISKVVDKIKKTVNKDQPQFDEKETIEGIKKYILESYVGEIQTKERAITAVNKIKNSNGLILRLNMREMEILNLVWNRIHDPVNKGNFDNLRENLVLELADCMTGDTSAHCIQGRVSRIIQSLEMADADKSIVIKPLWVIKDEIHRSVPRYVDKVLKKLPTPKRELFEQLEHETDTEKKEYEKIRVRIQSAIERKMEQRYLDSKMLTETQFTNIMKPCLEAIE